MSVRAGSSCRASAGPLSVCIPISSFNSLHPTNHHHLSSSSHRPSRATSTVLRERQRASSLRLASRRATDSHAPQWQSYLDITIFGIGPRPPRPVVAQQPLLQCQGGRYRLTLRSYSRRLHIRSDRHRNSRTTRHRLAPTTGNGPRLQRPRPPTSTTSSHPRQLSPLKTCLAQYV